MHQRGVRRPRLVRAVRKRALVVTVLLAGLWADELLRVDVGDAVRFTAIGVDNQRARGALVHGR